MQTQLEWLFVSMMVTNETVNHFGFNQTMIIYTINMKRRSLLYIANFLLPVFFFLCLDFGSFLMSDTGGEKVGFKITLLLSVTVMQLILNDILPCSSDRIPLTGREDFSSQLHHQHADEDAFLSPVAYCIGIFSLMLVSLLETILVIHLIGKDEQEEEKQRENDSREEKGCFTVVKKQSRLPSVENMPSPNKEGSTSRNTDVSHTIEKISEELGESRKTITLLCSRSQDKKPGYWTGVAQKINKVFAFIYIISAILFLLTIAIMWYPPHVQK
ncbi:5-hydroxytryptamine receptor 3A-like [Xiphophorus couchianus]|uniref:5-hydroxytryptamine receptor 3A-like n=1 Tax=Xiphophorus couchianus TaxID=32473 RepID=UPI001016C337|nr:5-hydroxytryptamine receptor 3A-like [Xiphophorus couchianus]